MSSSSSSDCECEDYCHYAAGFYDDYGKSVNRTPFYPTMGHPLIYYTQTTPNYQPPVIRRRSRKRDPNCFVRAFRWYTQERSNRNESNAQTDGTEFASWLDMKYDEYIENRSNPPNHYKLTVKQTAVYEAKKATCAGSVSGPNNVKTKFKRLKSPWTKRCRTSGNKQSGDIDDKMGNQSCQYILQPQDLTRPNSEYCQSSTVSTDCQKKPVCCSQSLTNLPKERSKIGSIEVKCTQEGRQLKKKDSSINKNVSRTKSDLVNVSCHCYIDNVSKDCIDAATQYSFRSVSRSVSKQASSIKPSQTLKEASQSTSPINTCAVYCECEPSEQKPVIKTCNIDVSTQYEPEWNEGICNVKALCQCVPVPKPPPRKCPCEMELEEFMVPVPAPLKLSNIGAQTSDRSITFDKGSSYNYPLFMKIICADKLIEENSK